MLRQSCSGLTADLAYQCLYAPLQIASPAVQSLRTRCSKGREGVGLSHICLDLQASPNSICPNPDLITVLVKEAFGLLRPILRSFVYKTSWCSVYLEVQMTLMELIFQMCMFRAIDFNHMEEQNSSTCDALFAQYSCLLNYPIWEMLFCSAEAKTKSACLKSTPLRKGVTTAMFLRSRKGGNAAYLLSRDQQDLMPRLLNPFLGAGDLDLVAGVIRAGDLDLSGSFELKVLQLLSTFANDKAMMLLGNGHRC